MLKCLWWRCQSGKVERKDTTHNPISVKNNEQKSKSRWIVPFSSIRLSTNISGNIRAIQHFEVSEALQQCAAQ